MSFAYSAASYNENENEPSNLPIYKKRSSHNRTQKKFDDQIIDQEKVNQVLQSMNSLQKIHNSAPEDVGELGNYFSSPPEKPISSGVQKTTDVKESMTNLGMQPKPAQQYGGDSQMDLNNFQENYGDVKSSHEYYKRFIPNFAQLKNPNEDDDDNASPKAISGFGNYMKSPIITGHASNIQDGRYRNASSPNQDILLEKLNYMIHLLEEQHDERTHSVTEEVILYSFLGIFIIFIVDSFCRIGKYTR
jgi:hypothetical protein